MKCQVQFDFFNKKNAGIILLDYEEKYKRDQLARKLRPSNEKMKATFYSNTTKSNTLINRAHIGGQVLEQQASNRENDNDSTKEDSQRRTSLLSKAMQNNEQQAAPTRH